MRKSIVLIAVLALIVFLGFNFIPKNAFSFTRKYSSATNLKTGDILFVESASGQGKAIQLATKSKWTHVGVVFIEDGKPMVYHAVNPVMKSPLEEFLGFSSNHKYVAKRIKSSVKKLNDSLNTVMKKEAISLLGKPYDIYFNWSDDEIYCTEYVWKLYNHAYKVEVGKLRPLKEFDLSSPVVKEIMKKRYGSSIPLDEKMISPGDMFDSEILEEVK